ncbi:MAG: DUF3368 domain-containing protein [Opitutales bacterium]|nr:DUF3368 domain-containing protein [Opitutales bacterium]
MEIELLRSLNSVKFVAEATPVPAFLAAELDPGEASVIHSAIIRMVPLVAIDEKQGRRIARLHQLKVTGSIGILLKGFRMGRIQDVPACLQRMREAGVWISGSLEARVFQEVGEG